MRRTVSIAAWVVLLLSGALAQAQSQAQARWTYFGIPGSDFIVTMPGNPKPMSDKTDAKGVAAKVYLSELGEIGLAADYAFFPRGAIPDTVTAEQFIEHGLRNGVAKDLKILSERKFKFANAAAAEFVAEKSGAKPAILKVRMYARRDDGGNLRVYQCTVGGPPGSENNADSLRFLDSFKFVPK